MRDFFTESSAVFPTPAYRTRLSRAWGPGPRLCVIGQNPSRADAERPDPTVTRCIRRARLLGLDGLEMQNLYPLVATYPDDLFRHPDPLGTAAGIDADAAILAVAASAGMVIAAWGGDPRHAVRAVHVRRLLERRGIKLHALGFTAAGAPRHPSRLAYSVSPEAWPGD